MFLKGKNALVAGAPRHPQGYCPTSVTGRCGHDCRILPPERADAEAVVQQIKAHRGNAIAQGADVAHAGEMRDLSARLSFPRPA